MPFEFDALRAEAWRILANDQLIEPVLLERFLALLGSRLEASRALLLVLDKDQFTCAQEWMAAAGKDRDEPLPARGGKMPVAATGPLLSAGDGRGFPAGILDTAADGVLAGATIVAALHVDSRAEGTFVLVRERAWPPSAAAFLSEAVRMLAHAVGRRRAETAMRQSELRYRIVSELCADFSCSWAVDAKGRFSFEWSTGARNGLASGFAVHSLTSTEAWLALFDAEGKAKLKDLVRRSLRNEPTVAELRTVAADGEEYWLQVHSRPVYDAVAERVVRVFTLMRDVTERVHAEQALRHERDLVRAILEASPDGICVSSLDDVIIECNAAAWRFMGLSSKKDMIGRKAFEFVENIDVAVATNFRDKVLASGAARGIRGRARTPAGELIPMEHSLGLVRDPSGQPFGFV
ncbi:MAG: PAS domain S-box protein, partial [Deltaproteobacteria bacterium]|nr:PAS domain S-box protein [Deltaproteobacteria bacterium]